MLSGSGSFGALISYLSISYSYTSHNVAKMQDAPWAQRKINCGPKTLFSAPLKHAIYQFFSTDKFVGLVFLHIELTIFFAKKYYLPPTNKILA